MLCEKCGKNAATTYFRQAINGKVTEYRLCDDCAAQMSGTSMFSDIDLGFFLGNMFQVANSRAATDHTDVVHCDGCGLSYDEIAKSGKMGCARCYDVFKEKLRPSLESIHGRTGHVGKIPKTLKAAEAAPSEDKKQDETTRLKIELQAAIADQDFERAAEIRDRLKELEGEGK